MSTIFRINLSILTMYASIGLALPGPVAGIGLGLETYQYKTKQAIPNHSQEQLLGIHINYDHPVDEGRLLRWHWYRNLGITHGTNQNSSADRISLNLNKHQQHDMIAGVSYQAILPISDTTSFDPHVGIEYRRFFHKDDQNLASQSYSRQKAQFALVPVGLDLYTSISQNWLLELSGTYQYLIYSQQIAYTSGSDLVLPTIKDIKANGYGTKLGADLHYVWEHARLGLGAFIQAWHIDANRAHGSSNLTASSTNFMPNNQTKQIGMHVMFHF